MLPFRSVHAQNANTQMTRMNGHVSARTHATHIHTRISCCRWFGSVKSLFWSMFGYGDLGWLTVVVDNRCRNRTGICHDVTQHIFTEGTGHFLFGMYNVLIVIILLNMLIAMMSDSLVQIQVSRFSVNRLCISISTIKASCFDSHSSKAWYSTRFKHDSD